MNLQHTLENMTEFAEWYLKNESTMNDRENIDLCIKKLQEMKKQSSSVTGTPTHGTSSFKELIQQRCERVFENVDVLTGQEMFALYKDESGLKSSAMVRDEILQAEQEGIIKRVPPHGLYCLANLHQEEDKQITAMKHILEDIFQKPINVVHHKPIHEKMDNKILEFNIISLLHENGEMNYSNIYNHFSDANVTVRQLDSVLNALKDRGVLKLRAMSGNCGKKIRMYSIKRKVAAEKNPVTNNGISQELADRIKQLVCDELKKATDESEFDGKL